MKILWTSSAVSDLESIREYISKDSVIYANRFIIAIIRASRDISRLEFKTWEII
jgi:plasmid stabilization system protein ParE